MNPKRRNKLKTVVCGLIAVGLLVWIAALFRAKAWSEISYSPTDGLAMAKEVQQRVYQDQNPGATPNGEPRIPVPDAMYLSRAGKHGAKDDCVLVYTYHFFRPLTPVWLKWIRSKTGKKTPACSVTWSSVIQLKRGTGIGGILVMDGSHLPLVPLAVHAISQEILNDLEPNSQLNINEDFVCLYVNGQVRVYSASKISPRMKELVAKVVEVPPNEIWKDVSTHNWMWDGS